MMPRQECSPSPQGAGVRLPTRLHLHLGSSPAVLGRHLPTSSSTDRSWLEGAHHQRDMVSLHT
jgi:hypothetical protein